MGDPWGSESLADFITVRTTLIAQAVTVTTSIEGFDLVETTPAASGAVTTEIIS